MMLTFRCLPSILGDSDWRVLRAMVVCTGGVPPRDLVSGPVVSSPSHSMTLNGRRSKWLVLKRSFKKP